MRKINDIFTFFIKKKKYWLLPLILLLFFVIFTIMYDESSIIAPFIYRIF
jgi:hypothetical protein